MRISLVLLVAASCALGNSKLLLNRLQNLTSKLQDVSDTYLNQGTEVPGIVQTYPWHPEHHLEGLPARNPNGYPCLQLPAVQYHIPNDEIIPFIIRTIFNALGRPEPLRLVDLANSNVLRQVQLYPRNVALTFQELRFNLKNCLDALPLPNGYRYVLLNKLVKYFELLPEIKLGGQQQQQDLYCHAKILIALIEAYRGTPLEPNTTQKFLDATILLTRLVSGPCIDLNTLKLPCSQQPSEKVYKISLELETGNNDQTTFHVVPEYPEHYYEQLQLNAPEKSEYNISVDINVDQEEYGRQPQVGVNQPTVEFYQSTYELGKDYESQATIDVYGPIYQEQPSVETVQLITEEHYQQPKYNYPEKPEYNISVDINIEQGEYGRQPKVSVNQPTVELYQSTYELDKDYESQATIDVHGPIYQEESYVEAVQLITEEHYQQPKYNYPEQPEYNISVDINIEQGEYGRQPKVSVNQPTVELYQSTYELDKDYESQATIDVHGPIYQEESYVEAVQLITEEHYQQPKYNYPEQPEYNISVDINIEQGEYGHQPKVSVNQPTVELYQSTYELDKDYESQATIDAHGPIYQEETYDETVQLITEEHHQQPKYNDLEKPKYNISVDIHVEQEEYGRQPKVGANQPTVEFYQSTYELDKGYESQAIGSEYSVQVGSSTVQEEYQQMESTYNVSIEEDYYPKNWINFVPLYGADPDIQTPAYILRPVSVEEAILSLQSTLQRFLTGNKPLVSLPKVIKTFSAVHRIKIDIKISIEKIVGCLTGYNPGLNDIVRQVYDLISPVLPHIPVGDLSGLFGISLVKNDVSQNIPKAIGAVVKVILDALRNSHPSVLRVFRDVLPKLFRTILLPSSASLQIILKQVDSLIKLVEPVWDKLPHRPALSPPKFLLHLHDVIKMVKQLSDVNKNFPRFLHAIPRASALDGIIRKIYYSLKQDGDCLNRETVVQLGWEIKNIKSAFPQVPASALKKIQVQLQELAVTLKTSCSNALIHRYVKDFESSLFSHWGIQRNEQLPENFFVQSILKSVRLHDLDEYLWGNFGDYIAALVGPSAPAALPARLAKINVLLRRFHKRTIMNAPNDYEVNNVALRIANLLAGVFEISHALINQLRGAVIKGLQLIRDVIHGRIQAHSLGSIKNSVVVQILTTLKHSPILQGNSHPLLPKLGGNIFNSINQYTIHIAEYQSIMKKYVLKINQIVTKQATRPLEQLLYRLPPIVKEMTKCSNILPYNSKAYFQKLLLSLSGRAVPIHMSYRLVNLVRQVRSQRCANHVYLPGSLGYLQTYLPGESYKKWHVKFAMRKVFTQVAFTSSVNAHLNNHLLYTIQHLLGVIQPHVVTSQQTAGDFVNSVRDWISSLVLTLNQPQQNHLVKRSVLKLSAKFTAILRPQQKQPPPELTNKFLELSNSILAWYQASSPQLLRQHTKVQIQDITYVLKSINSDVDSSQLQSVLLLLVTHLQGYAVNKDETLDNSSAHVTSTILELLGKDLPSKQKQQLVQHTKSILVILRNKSACLNKYSSDTAQHVFQEYNNFQRILRTNSGPEAQYLLQHFLEKVALTVTNTAMQPSVQAIPAPFEYLRPGYGGTCSANAPVVSIIPIGEHSLGQLWDLNLITALDTVKKGILLFLDDYGGHELARNVKEVIGTVLSIVTNDAISHPEKLSFSIKLAIRINNGVVVPCNCDTLKSVREIVDLSDLLSGIRNSYGYQKSSQSVLLTIKELVHKVSGLYGSAPTPQFAQSFQHLIEQLIKSRNAQNIQEILPLLERTTQSAQISWGHVVVPAKRISLNLALRNLLINIAIRISNSAVPISTWQVDLDSFQYVAKVIAPGTNPNIIVDLLKRVVYPIQKSYQCNTPSQVPISKDLLNLLQHLGNVAYKGEGRHDLERYTVFDHLLNNIREIACMKYKPNNKPDYIANDYSKYLHSLGLPELLAKNQIQRLFSIMLYNLPASRLVFRANIQSVVPVLVHQCLSSLGVTALEFKKQRLVVLTENLLEVIKHNVFQEKQIQIVVKIVNSLLWYPHNDHLHFGLDNTFYQLLRTITEDNGYSRYPKVTALLRNIKVGLTLSAVNNVPLNPTQILISSRLQPQQHLNLAKALHDLNKSLQNRQSHQPDGPLFDALLNLVHEVEKVLVPTKQLQSVLQAKRVVVEYLTQIIESHVSPQARNAAVMKTIGVIDEFIYKLEIHFGIILPKPVKRAPAVIGIPEGAELSNLSPAVLLAEFKGSIDRKFA